MPDLFDETALRAAISAEWGPAGSHIDVFDRLLAQARTADMHARNIEGTWEPALRGRDSRIRELVMALTAMVGAFHPDTRSTRRSQARGFRPMSNQPTPPEWVAQAGVWIILAAATLARALLVCVGARAVQTHSIYEMILTIGFAAITIYTDREVRRAWR